MLSGQTYREEITARYILKLNADRRIADSRISSAKDGITMSMFQRDEPVIVDDTIHYQPRIYGFSGD
jgi:hypothetical protein